MSIVVDLATAKAYLMIGHTQQDAIVQILADAAEDFLQAYLQCSFTSAAVQEYLDGGLAYLQPNTRPVTALTIQSGQTFPTVLDRVTGDQIVVALVGKGRIARADPLTGVPLLRPDFYASTNDANWPYWSRFFSGVKRFQANYTAGFATVSPLIKQAILQLIHRAYHARAGETSTGAKGASAQFGNFMDSDMAKMLQQYSQKSPVRV